MEKKYNYLIIFLIVASCAAFGRIAGNDFINLDDTAYITENHQIKLGINLQTIKWASTSIVASNWHPLTLISHALDWSIYRENASGHHLVSLFLHIGAVIFLFLFLNKTTNNIWSSAFAAAVFALHPLRVESVAWASERKDVLSMFFGMACLYVYAFYAEVPKISKYLLCLILFAMALMSKPMMVTLPFVLILLDYWPLERWQQAFSASAESRYKLAGKLVLEKVPFILLTIVASIITLWAQTKEGSVAIEVILPLATRVSNAIVSSVVYLGKIFWPFNLAVFYPYEFPLPLWKILISGFILVVITAVVIYYIKKLPFLFVGWFWYLGTLVPVIGLVQVGKQAMADRYTYLPSVGITIGLAWGISLLFPRKNIRKNVLLPAAIAILFVMVILTWTQCGYWKNSTTLFSHALRVTNDNYLAHNNLGIALLAEGRIKEAINYYNKAIHIDKDYYYAYINRGNAYTNLGLYQRAIVDYNKTISLNHNNIQAYYNRGNAYANLGLYQRAIADYNKAINLNSNYMQAYYNRGNAYKKLDQYKNAIADYDKAIRMKRDYADAYTNRGNAYTNLGQYQRAIADYNNAISLNPNDIQAYYNRVHAYLKYGDNVSGCRDAQKACELGDCKLLEWAKGKEYCR